VTARRARAGGTRDAGGADAGSTLVELMVAMSVFGVLMVLVGAASLTAFSTISDTTSRGQLQQETQNAMEWATRLVTFADVPEGQTSAIASAGPTSVDLYTYSGTGRKNDVPYRARLYVSTLANGDRAVYSQVWTPVKIAGGWNWAPTWRTTPATRLLLTVPAGPGSPLQLRYYACTPTTGCAASRREVTPAVAGPLTMGALEVPESVTITMGDPANVDSLVSQTVKLVNLS
jgi:prepilin-type N-terminal cleavage/methylation domain-containing protein